MHREDFTVAILHNLYNYDNVIDFSIQYNPKHYSLGHRTIKKTSRQYYIWSPTQLFQGELQYR